MARTPLQREADAQLSAAVEAASRAYNLPLDDGFAIVEFVVAVELVRFVDGPEGDATFDEFHGVLFQDGATRSTVAIGLSRIAEQLVGEGTVTSGRVPGTGPDGE